MSKTVIKVENLSKWYTLDQRINRTLKESIVSGARNLFSSGSGDKEAIKALNGISFEVKQGQTLGIIGPNGSGKSTLLKILSKITAPTEGQVTLRGKVASLLEVGTGFHPDLTGLENIQMNGVILGMKKEEVETRLEEIIEFSGIREFIHAPVKTYSSGMLLRLAFSVITALEVDIMLFDEVLAVGDAQFQEKSFNKIQELVQSGRTVIFISHNLNAIQNLCRHVIYLKNGQIKEQGPPAKLIQQYMKTEVFEGEVSDDSSHKTLKEAQEEAGVSALSVGKRPPNLFWHNPKKPDSTSSFMLQKVWVSASDKSQEGPLYTFDALEINLDLLVPTPGTKLDISIIFSDQLRNFLFASSTFLSKTKTAFRSTEGESQMRVALEIPPNFLNQGYFYLSIDVFVNDNPHNHLHPYLLLIKIEKDPKEIDFGGIQYPGAIRPLLHWKKS